MNSIITARPSEGDEKVPQGIHLQVLNVQEASLGHTALSDVPQPAVASSE